MKQNIVLGEQKFILTSLEKHFQAIYSPYLHETFKLDNTLNFQENIRWLDSWGFDSRYNIDLYKNNNLSQAIRHSPNHPKILTYCSVRENTRVFLKNLSGYLEHCGTRVDLWKFNKKQNNGIYEKIYHPKFKLNVKKIKSQDFEHYAEDVEFIFKTATNE